MSLCTFWFHVWLSKCFCSPLVFEELNSRFLPRHSWKFRESKRWRLVNKNKIQRVFGHKCRWKRCKHVLIKDVQRVITHVYSFNIEIFDSVNPSQSSMERYSIMDNKVVTKIVCITCTEIMIFKFETKLFFCYQVMIGSLFSQMFLYP